MTPADFPIYSPGSRRWIDFAEQGELDQLGAEVRRSLPPLVHAADNRVAKGSMTAAEADRTAATWRAIAEDFERGPDNRTGRPACACGCLSELKVAANGVRWEAKVDALRREIEARRCAYPAAIDKGQLTAASAKAQLERLEAVHDLYWCHGFAFDGTRDELRELGVAVMDCDAAQLGAAITSGDSSTVEHSAHQPTVAGSNPAPRSTAGATA